MKSNAIEYLTDKILESGIRECDAAETLRIVNKIQRKEKVNVVVKNNLVILVSDRIAKYYYKETFKLYKKLLN